MSIGLADLQNEKDQLIPLFVKLHRQKSQLVRLIDTYVSTLGSFSLACFPFSSSFLLQGTPVIIMYTCYT